MAKRQVSRARMTGSNTKAAHNVPRVGQWPVWAAHVKRPKYLDFDGFRNRHCIYQFNAKLSNGTIHLCMP